MLAVCGARRADWRRSGPPLAAAACIRLLTAAPSCWRSACASPSSAPAPFRKAACRTLASRERAWIAGGECKGQGLCCRWCWRGPDSPGSVPRWCSAAWPAPRGPCNPARRCQTVAHAMRHRLGSPGWCGPAADTCRRRSRPCRRWRPCGGRSAQCTLNEHQPSFPHPHTWCVVELEWFVGLLRCLARRAPLASGCLRWRRRASKCAQCAKWCVCIQFVLLKVWLVGMSLAGRARAHACGTHSPPSRRTTEQRVPSQLPTCTWWERARMGLGTHTGGLSMAQQGRRHVRTAQAVQAYRTCTAHGAGAPHPPLPSSQS